MNKLNPSANEDGSVGYGNEEDGYKPVHSVELYVEGDKNTPLEMREFIKMYLVRNIAYSEGFKIADQKKLMESFGFSEGEYEIPSRWMECAPDYKG